MDEDACLFVSGTLHAAFDASGAFWLLFVALFAHPITINAHSESPKDRTDLDFALAAHQAPFRVPGDATHLAVPTCLKSQPVFQLRFRS